MGLGKIEDLPFGEAVHKLSVLQVQDLVSELARLRDRFTDRRTGLTMLPPFVIPIDYGDDACLMFDQTFAATVAGDTGILDCGSCKSLVILVKTAGLSQLTMQWYDEAGALMTSATLSGNQAVSWTTVGNAGGTVGGGAAGLGFWAATLPRYLGFKTTADAAQTVRLRIEGRR